MSPGRTSSARAASSLAYPGRIGHYGAVAESGLGTEQASSRRSSDDLRWEHLARRVVRSPWYFFVYGIAILMAWLDNAAIAFGFMIPFVVAAFVVLPRTRWGKRQEVAADPRDALWADLLPLGVGVAYLVLAAIGSRPLWSPALVAVLGVGYLIPRLLHWLDV